MKDEDTLIKKEKEARKVLLKAKEDWLYSVKKLYGYQTALKIDRDIIKQLERGEIK